MKLQGYITYSLTAGHFNKTMEKGVYQLLVADSPQELSVRARRFITNKITDRRESNLLSDLPCLKSDTPWQSSLTRVFPDEVVYDRATKNIRVKTDFNSPGKFLFQK